MAVWWATEVECMSAIARLERQKELGARAVEQAIGRLADLRSGWHEVEPSTAVRRLALRHVRVHRLRAADAFQLAAAVTAADGDPAQLPLVTLDDRLAYAAEREGFPVLEPAEEG